jgi:D-alanine-D-alanine ligase
MRKLKVLCLAHEDLVPPDPIPSGIDTHNQDWRTENYVLTTLRKLGHEAAIVGVRYDLERIRSAVAEFKPDIVFNLLEEFNDQPLYDQNVVSLLELIPVPYTGCIIGFQDPTSPSFDADARSLAQKNYSSR